MATRHEYIDMDWDRNGKTRPDFYTALGGSSPCEGRAECGGREERVEREDFEEREVVGRSAIGISSASSVPCGTMFATSACEGRAEREGREERVERDEREDFEEREFLA
mmetsp:Transcript_28859/g.61341  ORF Transcript_28859/g.61341 Transcript_28859/m.61341 type:complete len:109 (+) Transcript_28859:150-476(+)